MPFDMNLDEIFGSFEVCLKREPAVPVEMEYHPTVIDEDAQPVAAIRPRPEGPWICGGAVLAWYQGRGVGLSDIDVFFTGKHQLEDTRERLVKYGAYLVVETANAATYHYKDQKSDSACPREWKIQLIKREFYDTIDDAINDFDITVSQLGTDGNRFVFGSNTLADITNKVLRVTGPLRANIVKRYCKYVAYGYTPVAGLHDAITENTDTTWEFDFNGSDYDDF